ncbi:hypothetical protein ACJ2_34070 [Pantoea sp. QMID2]|nr:hypothetical protein ACJ3_15400 [Pantoea sp. QMID3]GME35628.1 hypothetical protein ACJ1_15310 [Pantoea sp. QMID1]GME59626.1 hypothetical protein ACJ4_33990 [Pantoea sp. QMID4]GME61142.1 hypothetical protein ACJ2_34070 [Pantoea sp. QMID2]
MIETYLPRNVYCGLRDSFHQSWAANCGNYQKKNGTILLKVQATNEGFIECFGNEKSANAGL